MGLGCLRLAGAVAVLAMPAMGAVVALDSASDAVYGDGWQGGDNGGSGFSPWVLRTSTTNTDNAGFFVGTSTNNGSGGGVGIDSSGGVAWGACGNSGSAAAGFRGLNRALEPGDTFFLSMDNGWVNSGQTVGCALRNGNATNSFLDYDNGLRFEFFFLGGSNNYFIVDSQGQRDTGVPFTDAGLSLALTLRSNDGYALLVTNPILSTTLTGYLHAVASPPLSTVNSISVYNRNSGADVARDAFFNTLRVERAGDARENGFNHFVNITNANPQFPYTTWATAATVIQDALGAAIDGDVIHVAKGTYTEYDITMTNAVELRGEDARDTIIQASLLPEQLHRRVFHVTPSETALIAGVTIQNGYPYNVQPGGGGIFNEGQLTVSNVTVRSCTSGGGRSSYPDGADGGGILNMGTLTLLDSTIRDNRCSAGSYNGFDGGNGGGIANFGALFMVNCTVAENFAGSGAYTDGTAGDGGGIYNAGTAIVAHCAFVFNQAARGGSSGGVAGNGGGIANASGAVIGLSHTIVAGNAVQSGGSGADAYGLILSQGYNLIQIGSGHTSTGNSTGNLIGLDPRVGELQNHGGETDVAALYPGSPAINAGDPAIASSPNYDQRGRMRIRDGRIDIGPYEAPPAFADLSMSVSIDNGRADAGADVIFQLSVTNAGPDVAEGVHVLDVLPPELDYLTSSGPYAAHSGLWTIGDLAVGGTTSLYVHAHVSSQALGVVVMNTAIVYSAWTEDFDLANNGAFAELRAPFVFNITQGTRYSDIQSAVDIAIAGDVLELRSDALWQETVEITKSVVLSAGSGFSPGIVGLDAGADGLSGNSYPGSPALNISVSKNFDPGFRNATVVVRGLELHHGAPGVSANSSSMALQVEASAWANDAGGRFGASLDIQLEGCVLYGDVAFRCSASDSSGGPTPVSTWLGVVMRGNRFSGGTTFTCQGSSSSGAHAGMEVHSWNDLWLGPNPYDARSSRTGIEIRRTASSGGQADLAVDMHNGSVLNYDLGLQGSAAAEQQFVNMLLGNVDDVDAAIGAEDISFSLISDGTYAGVSGNRGGVPLLDGSGAQRPGSPGIDMGNNLLAPMRDHLGGPRILDGTHDGNAVVDAGAVELDIQLLDVVNLAVDTVPPYTNVLPGAQLDLVVTVSNRGPDQATGVIVSSLLSTGIVVVEASTQYGYFDATSAVWQAGQLLVGEVAQLVLNTRVDAGATGRLLTNHVNVVSRNQPDLDLGDNYSSGLVGVGGADLQLRVLSATSSANAGEFANYSVVVSNAGPLAAGDIVIRTPVDAGLETTFTNASQGVIDLTNLHWRVGALNVGQSARIDTESRVRAGVLGQVLERSADLSGASVPDAIVRNNSDVSPLRVPAADIGVEVVLAHTHPTPGALLSYELIVTNAGPDAASGLLIGIVLPPDLVPESVSGGQATFGASTGTWHVGSIPAGDTARLSLGGRLAITATNTNLLLYAGVSAQREADPNPANNGSAATAFTGTTDLGLLASIDQTPINEGSTTVYRVTVTNLGPADASGIGIDVHLPSSVTYVNALPGPGLYSSAAGRWTVAHLRHGDSAQLALTIRGAYGGRGYVCIAALGALDQVDRNAVNDAANAILDVRHSMQSYPWTRVMDGLTVEGYVSGAYSGGEAWCSPAFTDIDADGDLDLFLGDRHGDIKFFSNTGTGKHPSWAVPEERFNNIFFGDNSHIAPTFCDIDGDGDADLFIGLWYPAEIVFYENGGTDVEPQWLDPVGGYAGIQVRTKATPHFADIDADGDFDMFVGNIDGGVWFSQNIGDATNAVWSMPVTNYAGVTEADTSPFLVDIDGDGDLDLFDGNGGTLYENTGDATQAVWGAQHAGFHPGGTRSVFVDIDRDGDYDLFGRSGTGNLSFHQNVGSTTSATWAAALASYNSLDFGYLSSVTFCDIDGDGDLDMFGSGGGGSNSDIDFYQNLGTLVIPIWNTPVFGYGGFSVGTQAKLVFCDIDADGDEDAFVGEFHGNINFFPNIGTPQIAVWGTPNSAYAGVDVGIDSAPAFADIDADGDFDLFVGNSDGNLYFLENTGTRQSASWTQRTTSYGGVSFNTSPWSPDATPAFADVDGDGDLDLYLGDGVGQISIVENVGTAQNASWAPLVQSDIFADLGMSYRAQSTPAFADIDGDGDPDFFSGQNRGGVSFYRNDGNNISVQPTTLTIVSGETHTFNTTGHVGQVSWQFQQNASGASLGAGNGLYTAGANAGALDVIQARDAEGKTGRAYASVIDESAVASVGKAIVVAGGKGIDDPFWPNTDYVADQAFLTLRHRGFSKMNIEYLSYVPGQDVDGDGGDNDIDGYASLAAVANAFTNWARGTHSLFVYLANHGSETDAGGYMRLSESENLSAAQVNDWLTDLQQAYTTEVTVVLEFCYAGSFVDELAYAGPGDRVVVAATASDQETYFLSGGLVSFSQSFFAGLFQGLSIKQSFLIARKSMGAYQDAMMDDDGDGRYDPDREGDLARTMSLGASFIPGRDLPQIGRVRPNKTISQGTEVDLWAEDVSSVQPLVSVWCVIVPPGHRGLTREGIPVADIPRVGLFLNADTGRYENSFDKFTQPGTYTVVYYAQDIWGGVSLPKLSYVTQNGHVEKLVICVGETPPGTAHLDSIPAIAGLVYETFLSRRFPPDNIYYLGPEPYRDFDGDGTNDVQGAATTSNLAYAMNTWGMSADRLTVYLIGSGQQDRFLMTGGEFLGETYLDTLADTYEQGDRSLNIVMEFGGSGNYTYSLRANSAASGRIVIASSQPGVDSMKSFGGLFSFSGHFMSQIVRGNTIGESFALSQASILRGSGRLGQKAQLDDDGDGIPNERQEDGRVAANRYFGAAFVTGDDVPYIGTIMNDGWNDGSGQAEVWVADVLDADGISNIWCVVTPPEFDHTKDAEAFSLNYNAARHRYESVYTNLSLAGTYLLTFYAQDNRGEISPPAQAAILGADAFESDNGPDTATLITVAEEQDHGFHSASDEDWVCVTVPRFHTFTVSATQIGTNVDLAMDLYRQRPGLTLTNLGLAASSSGFGAYLAESLQVSAVALDAGIVPRYYVRIRQAVPGWGPDSGYMVSVNLDTPGNGVLVQALDALDLTNTVPGARVVLDGSVTQALDAVGPTWFADLAPGPHTMQVLAPPGYHPLATAAATMDLPALTWPTGEGQQQPLAESEGWSFVSFPLMPMGSIAGSVRDALTGEWLSGVDLRFHARSGIISNLVYTEGRPCGSGDLVKWQTDSTGRFPPDIMLPTVDWQVALAREAYVPSSNAAAVHALQPAETRVLRPLLLSPIDANADRVADDWVARHFGGGGFQAFLDSDGDGRDNHAEYWAGTDPTNAQSVLRLDLLSLTNSGPLKLSFVWPTAPGRVYDLLCLPDLRSNDWIRSSGPYTAANDRARMEWSIAPSNASRGLYRLRVIVPGGNP